MTSSLNSDLMQGDEFSVDSNNRKYVKISNKARFYFVILVNEYGLS